MLVSALVFVAAALTGEVLYDNGPLVTHPGGGAGGADASVVQTSLGLNTLGFGHQIVTDYAVADDFEVPLCGWKIDWIVFYGYQTSAPTSPSTFTEVRLQILDGDPSDPGSQVVYGDLTTNRLSSSEWTGCYRMTDTEMNSTSRPIMANRCELSPGLLLGPGVYWVVWQADGTLTSGPWAPPITVLGQTTTGNGKQRTTGWAPLIDTGTPQAPQGLPFLLEGTSTPVERTSWGAVKALFR